MMLKLDDKLCKRADRLNERDKGKLFVFREIEPDYKVDWVLEDMDGNLVLISDDDFNIHVRTVNIPSKE